MSYLNIPTEDECFYKLIIKIGKLYLRNNYECLKKTENNFICYPLARD
jgi:hypothetical protein